jgi:non-canonical (house-cleaning) NTP pyrophosphatase
MFSGALNRARQALANIPTASFGVGIEGGTRDADGEMWAYACVVIVDRIGNVGKGQTGATALGGIPSARRGHRHCPGIPRSGSVRIPRG